MKPPIGAYQVINISNQEKKSRKELFDEKITSKMHIANSIKFSLDLYTLKNLYLTDS